jgi:ABC-type Fe3+ transport system permease subunit
VTLVAVWKEAGFFMIFYLAALQSLNPSLREAAAIEGASRWYFFRRVQWPLLMPTTLFVMVNAVINAVRMVDHIVVLTRGGPNNASTLLLYHLYEVGFSFWDTGYAAALTVVLLAVLAGGAVPVLRARPQGALQMSRLRARHPANPPGLQRPDLARHGWPPGCWRCCGSCRWPTRCGPRSTRPSIPRASCCWRR